VLIKHKITAILIDFFASRFHLLIKNLVILTASSKRLLLTDYGLGFKLNDEIIFF